MLRLLGGASVRCEQGCRTLASLLYKGTVLGGSRCFLGFRLELLPRLRRIGGCCARKTCRKKSSTSWIYDQSPGRPGCRGPTNDKFDTYCAPYGARSALHGDRCSDWPAGQVPRGLGERAERNQ